MSETLTTKHELLDLLRTERADLESHIAKIDAHQADQGGAMGAWTGKDLVAHLTAWRRWSLVRIDAAREDNEPAALWPSNIDGDDVDAINDWFHSQDQDKSFQQVLDESQESFDRFERGITELSDEKLFTPGRFSWLKDKALGPAIVRSSVDHYDEEHKDTFVQWIDRTAKADQQR